MPTTIRNSFVTIVLLAAFASAGAVDWIYSARPGDNLWNLSERYLERGISYTTKLQTHNRIEDPYHILPGTPIRIPVEWLRLVPSSALVVQVQGEAHIVGKNDTTRQALEIGRELFFGDIITTGEESSLTVEFADGSRLLLQSNAEAEMDTLSAYEGTGMVDTHIRLQGGRVESNVTPNTGAGSRFLITTPAATAAVRGTKFRVGADNQDAVTLAEVTNGSIEIIGAGSKTSLPEGFGIVASADSGVGEPVVLLEAPDVSAVATHHESMVLSFDWPAVTQAKSYRAQLFADESLSSLLVDTHTLEPRVEWSAPADGAYVFRVRAIDFQGLEGFDALMQFTLNARPNAPSLLEPKNDAGLFGNPPQLWWSEPQNATSYHLQVARNEGFSNLLVEQHTSGADSRFTFDEIPPPGTYFWRIATVEGDQVGPFSKASIFRILAVPTPVSEIQPDVGAETMQFDWQPTANTSTYHFQLATDDAFTNVLIDEQIVENHLKIPTPKQRVVYFRARGISTEGVEGPFSAANRVELPADPDYRPFLLLLPLLLLL